MKDGGLAQAHPHVEMLARMGHVPENGTATTLHDWRVTNRGSSLGVPPDPHQNMNPTEDDHQLRILEAKAPQSTTS